MSNGKKIFLFSVDLEDVRMGIHDGEKYKERVPAMTNKYLEFLNKYKAKCTFFVVGKVAEKYPSLIKIIYEEGHEIACHSSEHIPITQMDKKSFKEDLLRNIDSVNKAGVGELYGFRAPTYSLTKDSKWVYDVLEEMGFKYSSSVLPANNPLFGWKEFGTMPKIMGNVAEFPISITNSRILNVPFGGGIYFRVLPGLFTNYYFRKFAKAGKPIFGYMHPYDIDTQQEKFMHPGINNNKFYNFMMFYNRRNVFNKLEKVFREGFEIMRYVDFQKKFYPI